MTSRDPKADPTVDRGGDEADDDPQLKSLRAVWLSMPDEDPPDRGLAALMAAARVKADEMARPSLWQRIAALLRRPPVLALATVLVLIGGAVFIGQRKESIGPAEPVVEVERTRDLSTGSAATAPTPEQTPTESGQTATQSEEVAPEPPGVAPTLNAAPAIKQHATADPQPAPARPSRKPSATKPPTSTKPADVKASPTRGATHGGDDRKDSDTSFESKLEANEGVGEKQPVSGDKFAQPPPPPSPAPPRSPAPQAEAPSADSTVVGGASPTGTTSAPSRAPQYIAQAKSAASRGDCTVARTLMKRVAKEDATAYRNALASDAALKKCVGVVAQ